MTNSHIAVLARLAQLGEGKRRLARTLGDERTLAAYTHLIEQCAAAIKASGLPATVFQTPALGDEDIWSPQSFALALQASGTLGDRIRACTKQVLAKAAQSTANRTSAFETPGALVMGTDCPTLTPYILQQAATALKTHDAVLGPTVDGGYYLIGMKKWDEALVTDIAWSTEQVADQTREAMRSIGWSWYELPRLNDVDEQADWDNYCSRHDVHLPVDSRTA